MIQADGSFDLAIATARQRHAVRSRRGGAPLGRKVTRMWSFRRPYESVNWIHRLVHKVVCAPPLVALQRPELTKYLGTSRQTDTIRFLRKGVQDSRQGTTTHTRTGVTDIMSTIRTFAIRIDDSAFGLPR